MLQEMTKDELKTYAKDIHGIDIDMKKSIDVLVKEIEALEVSDTKSQAIDGVLVDAPEFLLNKATGKVFEYTKILAERDGFIACLEDGKPV